MKKQLTTPDAPAAIGPYSQGLEVSGMVFISGQIPLCPKSGEMVTEITEATHLVLKNMEAVLKSNGMSLDNVVKTTVFMVNMGQFHQMNEVYKKYFNPAFPARSTLGVTTLPKGAVVEIECIAMK